jgi:hypothetical protein
MPIEIIKILAHCLLGLQSFKTVKIPAPVHYSSNPEQSTSKHEQHRSYNISTTADSSLMLSKTEQAKASHTEYK